MTCKDCYFKYPAGYYQGWCRMIFSKPPQEISSIKYDNKTQRCDKFKVR